MGPNLPSLIPIRGAISINTTSQNDLTFTINPPMCEKVDKPKKNLVGNWIVDMYYHCCIVSTIKYCVRMISNKSLLCKVCFYDCVIILLNPTKGKFSCWMLDMNANWVHKYKCCYKETYSAFISEHYHIFVGDLSPEIETQTLREAFLPFGEIS